jgi:hypothetical protein
MTPDMLPQFLCVQYDEGMVIGTAAFGAASSSPAGSIGSLICADKPVLRLLRVAGKVDPTVITSETRQKWAGIELAGIAREAANATARTAPKIHLLERGFRHQHEA